MNSAMPGKEPAAEYPMESVVDLCPKPLGELRYQKLNDHYKD